MIDRGDIRQAIDRCSNIWAYRRALLRQFAAPTAWLQNSKKRAERSERLMYEQSHRDYLRSGYLHHRLPSWAVNHYRDNAITYKAQRDKNARELEAGERGNYWHADASAWCCCADAKYTKELADAKAENDALRDDVAAGRRRLHIKAVCQSVREATRLSAWIMQPPPDWQTPLNGIISPSERLITMQKQLEANPEVY